MAGQRNKPSNPRDKSPAALQIALLTSLPAIVVAFTSPVTTFFLWPYDENFVGLVTSPITPIALVLWLVLACAVGWYTAGQEHANIGETLALIVAVHLGCLAIIYFSLGMATYSAM